MDDYIEIDKEEIPYSFEMEFGGTMFKFEVNYNVTYDYFTMDLYREDELIAVGQKVVYGVPLFEDYSDVFPVTIVPLDASEKESRVSFDNLEETVFLYILEGAA